MDMSFPQYHHNRSSQYVATDEIPTVQYRRSSRRFSEIKISQTSQVVASNYQLLDSLKPADEEGQNGDTEIIYKDEEYAPEGPWGWAIVASTFCVNFVVDGISLSYGVMTDELTEALSQGAVSNETELAYNGSSTTEATPLSSNSSTDAVSSPGTITLTELNTVGSTLLGITLMMGPLASIIATKIGFRKTAMCGSVIATIGIFSSWAFSPHEPSFLAFLFGFGILGGIGFGILFTTSVVIVGLYFDKYRPFATGITVAGTGVGTFTMAPVMKSILRSYGWQGAIIFQTVLCAVSILCGLVYQPLPKRKVAVKKSELMLTRVRTLTVKEQLVELLMSGPYWTVAVSGCFIMMGYFAPFGFLYVSAKVHIGEDPALLLLTYLGVANTIGRVLFGILATKIGHALDTSNVALTVGGLVTMLYPFATTHASLIFCSVVFGLYSAVFASLRSILIMDICGQEKFNVGFGLSLLFMGLATFCSNSVGGYIKERTGNFDISFYVAGGFLLFSAVMCYPLSIMEFRKKRIKEDGEDLDYLNYKGSNTTRKSLVDVRTNN